MGILSIEVLSLRNGTQWTIQRFKCCITLFIPLYSGFYDGAKIKDIPREIVEVKT